MKTAAEAAKALSIRLDQGLIDQAKRAYWVDVRSYPSWAAWVAAAIAEKVERTKTTHGLAELPPPPNSGNLPPGPRAR